MDGQPPAGSSGSPGSDGLLPGAGMLLQKAPAALADQCLYPDPAPPDLDDE